MRPSHWALSDRLSCSSELHAKSPIFLPPTIQAVYVTSVAFHYDLVPFVARIFPELTSTSGASRVDVYGSNFHLAHFTWCRFGMRSFRSSALVVPAFVLSGQHLYCMAPTFPFEGVYNLEVSSNGVDFTADEVRFQAVLPPRLDALAPMGGPFHGGTVVHVFGEHFVERAFTLDYVRCRFNTTRVFAQFVSAFELICVAPQHHPVGPVTLEVTTDGQTFSACGLRYTYRVVVLHSLQPTHGPFAGGTQLSLLGSTFDAPLDLGSWCIFNETMVVPASFQSPNEVVCTTPPVPAGGVGTSVTVSLRSNGATVLAALPFFYQPDAQIDSFFPLAGPVRSPANRTASSRSQRCPAESHPLSWQVRGGTVLALTGRRLWHSFELSCRFGSQQAAAGVERLGQKDGLTRVIVWLRSWLARLD